jgi:hypothetical protein
MKQNINFFADDFNDYQPKRKLDRNKRSKQVSFSELDYDNSSKPSKKKNKYVDLKRY